MEPKSAASPSPALSMPFRCISAAEFLLGAFLVIAHNVYHLVPNEVPILYILAMLSFRLRDGGWRTLGLNRPSSWRNTILIALAVAALRVLLGDLVIQPLTSHFWPPIVAPHDAETITHNLKNALLAFGLIWTFAAFGEEISYRGYLLTRAADIAGRSTLSFWVALIPMSVLFGYGHFYKGPAGILDSGIAGLLLGAAYLLSGRNLWVAVLAHGFIDTFAIVVVYFGWAT